MPSARSKLDMYAVSSSSTICTPNTAYSADVVADYGTDLFIDVYEHDDWCDARMEWNFRPCAELGCYWIAPYFLVGLWNSSAVMCSNIGGAGHSGQWAGSSTGQL